MNRQTVEEVREKFGDFNPGAFRTLATCLEADIRYANARLALLQDGDLAKVIARSLWGYFEGGSAGSAEAIRYFDNHCTGGAPKFVIERVQYEIESFLSKPVHPKTPAKEDGKGVAA